MVERKGNQRNHKPGEETKQTQDSSGSEEDLRPASSQESKHPFPRPLQKSQLYAYSRYLHRKTPPNYYHREKIPWKTIMVAFLFLALGVFLMYLGLEEYRAGETSNALERLCLGAILFIPGSFHSVHAFQALRGVPGWTYEHLTVFENEDFFKDD